MDRLSKYILLCSIIFLLLLPFGVSSQEIKKDVTVLKPYQPVVNDASKINQMPVFNDTTTLKEEFQYKINSVKTSTSFQPRTVPAATIAPETVKELHNNYIKLGIGNPFAPLAEISISNGISKENAYGVYFRHESADGKVKLDNAKGTEVDAPYSDNHVELYGKHLYKHAVIKGKVNYTANKLIFYGYEPSLQPKFNLDSNTQKYHQAGAEISLNSLGADSNKVSYDVKAKFTYLSDAFSNAENNILIAGSAQKMVKGFYAGTAVSYNYILPGGAFSSFSDAIFSIKPNLSKSRKDWRFEAGLNISVDSKSSSTALYPYPYAKFEFTVAPQVLKAFIGYDGELVLNHYSSLIKLNPFIRPGLIAKNSNCSSRVTAGFKGNISTNSQFVASVSYSNITDQLFFINDTIGPLYNKFVPVYADAEIIKVKAEAIFKAMDKLDIYLSGSFSNYSLMRQAQPWNAPLFDASASVRYNIANKIISTTNIFVVGQRYGRNPISKKQITLSTFADINETVEYKYTKLFSIFIQLKNLTATRYQYWNQYPAYRFQIMGGVTYIF
jgi:hypothetical protein